MIQRILLFALLAVALPALQAQGTFYGIKGGMTQQWNTFDRAPLIGYHGILSVEGVASSQSRSTVFMQVGYHQKGSAIRRTLWGNPFNANVSSVPPQKFEFYNLSLSLGMKKYMAQLGAADSYFLFGVRGDYTIDTNLDEYERFTDTYPTFASIYPLNVYYFWKHAIGRAPY
ncbi:MAG: hypothetical protein R2795_23065 [Saprospiraceae bacterium]